ncbi:MAG: hypothetical protein JOZ43_07885, partial [Acidobacteriales bacterium]|nr:hypothetical protein [Terriglobales bacterium]
MALPLCGQTPQSAPRNGQAQTADPKQTQPAADPKKAQLKADSDALAKAAKELQDMLASTNSDELSLPVIKK